MAHEKRALLSRFNVILRCTQLRLPIKQLRQSPVAARIVVTLYRYSPCSSSALAIIGSPNNKTNTATTRMVIVYWPFTESLIEDSIASVPDQQKCECCTNRLLQRPPSHPSSYSSGNIASRGQTAPIDPQVAPIGGAYRTRFNSNWPH